VGNYRLLPEISTLSKGIVLKLFPQKDFKMSIWKIGLQLLIGLRFSRKTSDMDFSDMEEFSKPTRQEVSGNHSGFPAKPMWGLGLDHENLEYQSRLSSSFPKPIRIGFPTRTLPLTSWMSIYWFNLGSKSSLDDCVGILMLVLIRPVWAVLERWSAVVLM